MTSREFILKAQSLRTKAKDAEREFLVFLVSGESDEVMWRALAPTYDGFLKQTNLVDPARYRNFRASLERAPEMVAEVGVEASIAAGSLKSTAAVREALSEARVCEETNGTSISEQTARAIVNKLKERTAVRSAGHKSYPALLSELERVTADRDRWREKAEAYKAEVASLKASARPKVSDKRARAHA